MNARTSRLVLWAACLLIIAVRWTVPQREVITWDVFGYYLYLPATIIHDDIGLHDRVWLDDVLTTYGPSSTLYQVVDGPEGGRVIKYSAGMALAYSPFFVIAHAFAKPLGFPADGFSAPYQISITIGCLAFALFGLFLLRRILLTYFDDRWTAVLLVLVALGTNYFQLTAWDGTLLTHSFLFTLYAALILATIRWHAAPTIACALWIGGLIGSITLVRPSEMVCALIPLLWGLGSATTRATKWEGIKRHPGHIFFAALAFIIAVLPQLVYWKSVTGQWLFYSYVNPGEGFDFAEPHTWPYLVSFRKGWFIYTPLMFLAVCGIPLLWKRIPEAVWAIAIFLIVDLWVVSSWSCWWYAGGSFSARSMVPTYALLALPLGAFLQFLWSWKILRVPVALGLSFGLLLNIFQTWQWTQGILSKERMTRPYYEAVFGKTKVTDATERLLLVERPLSSEEHFTDEANYTARDLFISTFEDRPDSVFHLTPEDPYSPGPDVPYETITQKDHAWIRTSARLWVGESGQDPPTMIMTFHHNGEVYKYASSTWTIPAGTRNTWVNTTMDYITPEVRSIKDNLKVYIWNEHGGDHLVDDLRVQVYERK